MSESPISHLTSHQILQSASPSAEHKADHQMTGYLTNEEATMVFAGHLARVLDGGVVFLLGTLGMGKTTLSRGLIQALGHQGAVKSPTYTLVESYPLTLTVNHFDLYRLSDPEELEYMGIREYLADDSLCLIEWPEKGIGVLPTPDLVIELSEAKQHSARCLTLSSIGDRGTQWLKQLEKLSPEIFANSLASS